VPELAVPGEDLEARAFCGIHVLSPTIFSAMQEEGTFSVIPTYLNLAAQRKRIVGFPADGYYWRDLGKPEHIAEAAREIDAGVYPF
jgi:NDP-sugar pyrophosphorylase family protein